MLTKHRGFSLIEAIITIALVALALAVVSQTIVALVRSFNAINQVRTLASGEGGALERLTRETRSATGVNAGSSLGVNPSVLILNTTDAAGNPTTSTFKLNTGALILIQNNITATLTPASLVVTNFMVQKINTPVSQAVKIDLSAQNGALQLPLHDTIVLRGSY